MDPREIQRNRQQPTPGRIVDYYHSTQGEPAWKCVGIVTAVHDDDGKPQRVTMHVLAPNGGSLGGHDARYDEGNDKPRAAFTWCWPARV